MGLSEGNDGPCGAVTGPWHNQGCDNALPFKGIVPMPQDYRIGNYLCCVATVANRFGSARAARHKGMDLRLCSCPVYGISCKSSAWERRPWKTVPKQYRAKVVDLQALADSVRSGEVPKARLEKEAKAWVSEVEKHFRMAGPKKKGSAGAAVGSATETNRLLERISLQLEQVTEVLCKLAKVPVPGTPSVEEEFGGGEVVEE
ncbi:predicted protein [Histoplasma mississippiense (nom. inval.)]|uniref:predicted protein n=1 Tax=Ajellomyces capsulatus (strain NAm1 / WU24) TaxID=2059318 RepID=UPI000157BA5B|nr:predicted protein [Histoplasma mississippiense (nom. inval.)]EDN04070.1 predicted protein [Histoplasma mississippiense (nom. inval.)]